VISIEPKSAHWAEVCAVATMRNKTLRDE